MSANTTATLSLQGFADEIVLQQGATFLTFGGLRVDAGQLVQLAAGDTVDTFLKVEASLRDGDWIATSVTPLRRVRPTQGSAPAAAPAPARPAPPAPANTGAANAAPHRGLTPTGFGRPALVAGTLPAASPAPAPSRTTPAPPPLRPAGGSPFAGLMGSRPATSAAAQATPARAAGRPAFDPNADDLDQDIPF